jgi:hypothetical protein
VLYRPMMAPALSSASPPISSRCPASRHRRRSLFR